MTEKEYLNHKYANKHSPHFQGSRFYVEDNMLRVVNFNPDSNTGGQLVTHHYSPDAIIKTYKKHSNINDFWAHSEGRARQYLTDIDAPAFADEARGFVESPCDFNGNNKEAMNTLRDWAIGMEHKPPEQGMTMAGI